MEKRKTNGTPASNLPIQSKRNVAVVAPGGAGKSTIIEGFLYVSGAVEAAHRSFESGAVTATEPEELDRHISITTHLAHAEWKNTEIRFVDTPGYLDFLEQTRGVLPGVDAVLFVVSAVDGLKSEGLRLWEMISASKLPVLVVVNQVDRAEADFTHVLEELHERIGSEICPVTFPIHPTKLSSAVVDLRTMEAFHSKGRETESDEIPSPLMGDVKTLRRQLIERIAESNDAFLEHYLAEDALSGEELGRGMKDMTCKRAMLPVFVASGREFHGLSLVLDAVVELLPSPTERDALLPVCGRGLDGRVEVRTSSADEPCAAMVLKTSIDPFSGRISYVRVFSGTLKAGQSLFNSTRDVEERVGNVFRVQGKQLESVGSLKAGDIGAIAKLELAHTGDTLCDSKNPICFTVPEYLTPPLSYAVEIDGSAKEEKTVEGLAKIVEEDPTLKLFRDESTNELILAGMGHTQLVTALERLTRKFGGHAKLKTPRIPYRETIKKKLKVQGKIKKQTGGHGQFAVCSLEIEPLPRDAGFEFEDRIVGGVIPKQYIPAVKKGVLEALRHGVLGGYPVVDVKVALVDGQFHSVDSSDYAFQAAGSQGMKTALEEGECQLLEPIMSVEVSVPLEVTGEIVKDLSSRRGRVLGMSPHGNTQVIDAETPLSEVLEYADILNSMSSGRGTFSMRIRTYREVPPHVYGKITSGGGARAQSS